MENFIFLRSELCETSLKDWDKIQMLQPIILRH